MTIKIEPKWPVKTTKNTATTGGNWGKFKTTVYGGSKNSSQGRVFDYGKPGFKGNSDFGN